MRHRRALFVRGPLVPVFTTRGEVRTRKVFGRTAIERLDSRAGSIAVVAIEAGTLRKTIESIVC